MTVEELIEILKTMPPKAIILKEYEDDAAPVRYTSNVEVNVTDVYVGTGGKVFSAPFAGCERVSGVWVA